MALAVDVATFKAHFPSFVNTDVDLVQAKLDESEVLHRPPIWSNNEKRILAILYKTACLLALEPTAKCLRLSGSTDNGYSIYEKQYQSIARAVHPRMFVL